MRSLLVALCLLLAPALALHSDAQPEPFPERPMAGHRPDASQLESLEDAIVSLPIAALLGAALALRPRRPGTPPRSAPVIQTQIILALVGAVVMLVVGSSMARAFAIVGAASLIRYRAKIDDPKDAGVMLSTLAVGLAAGVGLYALAAFATVFILITLWVVESFEPESKRLYNLKVSSKELATLRPKIEAVLRRYRLGWEVRGSSDEEVSYDVKVPLDRKITKLPDAIVALDTTNSAAVEWEEKKKGKKKA